MTLPLTVGHRTRDPVPSLFAGDGLESGHSFFISLSGAVMTPALDLLKKVRAEHRIHSYEHDPKAASKP